MKECPILFSAPMVRALLAGTKTQTRRIVKLPESYSEVCGYWKNAEGKPAKPDEIDWSFGNRQVKGDPMNFYVEHRMRCPYGIEGDRLWVRETWGLHRHFDITDWERRSVAGLSSDQVLSDLTLDYQADWATPQVYCYWRPSIHMPRWASRITLEITGVRVERLQAISEADAVAEGIEPVHPGESKWQTTPSAVHRFRELWDSINGKHQSRPGVTSLAHSWGANPWVWVVEFKRVMP